MSKPLRIALIQMTSQEDISENIAFIENEIRVVAEQGAKLIVLPEMFAQFGVSDQIPLARAEADFNGAVGQVIRQLAKDLDLWIVAGTVPISIDSDDRPRARCHVINANGDVETYYDKIHLFDAAVGDKQGVYRESDSYSPGERVVTFDSPWGRFGLAVCYDLRFPELFRALNDSGATLVFLPSAFTFDTGQAHWEVLLRARAIENGIFVVAPNQTGQHSQKRRTWGHTMVVNPWGDVMQIQEGVNSLVCDIDQSLIEAARQKIPVNTNRRL